MPVQVIALDKPELAPLSMPDRFRHDVAYFMSVAGEPGVPALGAGEFWISLPNAREWLESGVIDVVSPLDSENRTEVELSEDQEDWLSWMVANQVQHLLLV